MDDTIASWTEALDGTPPTVAFEGTFNLGNHEASPTAEVYGEAVFETWMLTSVPASTPVVNVSLQADWDAAPSGLSPSQGTYPDRVHVCWNAASGNSALSSPVTGYRGLPGDTVTLIRTPNEDTYASEVFPDDTHGNAAFLFCYGPDVAPAFQHITYVRFNVSSIPAGSTIDSVELTLTADWSSGTDNLSVYKVTEAWSETSVTWRSQPAYDATRLAYAPLSSPTWSVNSVAHSGLKNAVSSWVNGASNRGFRLAVAGASSARFFSSEHPTGGKPTLVVRYRPPPDTVGDTITNLRSKTSSSGSTIAENTWQRDDDPYFYWDVPSSASPIAGYSFSDDGSTPDEVVDIVVNYYQYPSGSFGNGAFTFKVRSVDASGNWGPATSFVFKVDRQAPSDCTISINNGAAETSSLVVSLSNLAASDAHSGVSEMRFSNDNAAWSDWESYGPSKDGWDLSAYGGNSTPGTKTVFAQYRDAAGNISTAFTDSIILVGTATRIIRLSGDLVFGNVTVGQTATRTLTIHNDGNSTLNVSGITYPAGFSGDWVGGVAATGSQPVTVTFAPTAAQAYGGDLTVNSDKTDGVNTNVCSGTGRSGSLEEGLVAYYPFDGNAQDATTNANHGTVVGAAFAPDRFGKSNSAVEFDGAGNYVEMIRALPDFSNGTFTAWLFITQLDAVTRKVFFEGNSVDGHDYDLTVTKDWTRFRTKDDSYLDGPALPTGRWLHLAAVADGDAGKLQLWIDGFKMAEKAAPSVANVGYHQQLQLGRIRYHYSDFFLQGRADDCRFYNRALSSGEIETLYYSGVGLVAYFPFDGKANDASGNGHDATVYGASLTADRFSRADSAYFFDGSSSYMDVAAPATLQLTNAITVAAWINLHGGSQHPRIVSYGGNFPENYFGYEFTTIGGGNPRQLYFVYGGQDLTSLGSVAEDSWHFVAAVATTNSIAIYIDGTLDAARSIPAPHFLFGGVPMYIGRKAPSPGYDAYGGALDDVRIYDRALLPSEIRQLYALGRPILSNPRIAPDGSFIFEVGGDWGLNCRIEVSTNLLTTNWNPVATLSNVFGTVQFTNANAGQFRQQFFRAVKEPQGGQ